jgi:hypothetical protein
MFLPRTRGLRLALAAVLPSIAIAVSGAVGTALPGSVPQRPLPHDEWVITSVGPAHTTYGTWKICYTLTPQPLATHASCTGKRITSNSVSGSLGVGIDGISASVGFDCTTSYEITGSQVFPIAANAGGTIRWRQVYSTKTVHQTEYHYPLLGARTVVTTVVDQANKYVSPTFLYVP